MSTIVTYWNQNLVVDPRMLGLLITMTVLTLLITKEIFNGLSSANSRKMHWVLDITIFPLAVTFAGGALISMSSFIGGGH